MASARQLKSRRSGKKPVTYAFIDSQSLNLSVRDAGWRIDFKEYGKAVIVSGDGDFQCLAKYLHEEGKLGALLIPNREKFSALLKFDFLKPYHRFVNDLRAKVEYTKKSPREDEHSKGKTSIGDMTTIAKKPTKLKKKEVK